jgi:hypothetical protein
MSVKNFNCKMSSTMSLLPLVKPSTNSPSCQSQPHTPTISLIHHLLTPSECEDLISKHGPDLSSATTNYAERDRCVFDDASLSALLYARITDCYLAERVIDDDDCTWTPSGLNPRFRLARYGPGKHKSRCAYVVVTLPCSDSSAWFKAAFSHST